MGGRPAAQVRPDLVVDLLAVQRVLDRADGGNVPELRRVAAKLSATYGSVLTRLGEHGSALRWWRTGRKAAESSGDLDLALRIRGKEGIFGLYGQRAPETVLRLVDRGLEMAGSRPSIGLIELTGARSQTLSLLGRHEEARREFRELADLTVRLPAPSDPYGWVPEMTSFVESWTAAFEGREADGATARERVERLARARGCYQNATNPRLHEALCVVAAGGVDQGVRTAAQVIDGVPGPYRSHMIMETGRMVLRAVPAERQDRPAVGELREMLEATPASEA